MSGAIPPLPQYAFMAWCSVKAQGQLYLYSNQMKPSKYSVLSGLPSYLNFSLIRRGCISSYGYHVYATSV
jgi:hypothetical protein